MLAQLAATPVEDLAATAFGQSCILGWDKMQQSSSKSYLQAAQSGSSCMLPMCRILFSLLFGMWLKHVNRSTLVVSLSVGWVTTAASIGRHAMQWQQDCALSDPCWQSKQ